LNDPFELPSLEEIKEMEKAAITSIRIIADIYGFVECQKCGITVPIVWKLTSTNNDRIAILQKRIKWIENYNHENNSHKKEDVKALKAKLADLLEEYKGR
jgi:hypothetical protein